MGISDSWSLSDFVAGEMMPLRCKNTKNSQSLHRQLKLQPIIFCTVTTSKRLLTSQKCLLPGEF